MDFIDKGIYEEEHKYLHQIVINGLLNNALKMIQVVSIGAIDSDYIHSYGYYMVELKSSTYTLQEYKTIDGQVIDSELLVANGK